MYKEKQITPMRIIAIVAILVSMITLFLPWVHLGVRTEKSGMVDLNTVLKIIDNTSIDDVVQEYINADIDDFIFDDFIPKDVIKEFNAAKKAIVKIGNALQDSKLSPVEMAPFCSNMAKFIRFLGEADTIDDDIVKAATSLTAVGIGLWALILTFVGFGIYGIYAALTSKKAPTIASMCIYFVLFSLFLGLSVKVNQETKQAFKDAFFMAFIGIQDFSILHIQFAPILGCLLLAANTAAGILMPAGTGGIDMSRVGAGIDNIGKKMVWKCGCGTMNPTTSRFCPKCGKSRPEDRTPVDIRADVVDRLVWTCFCGSVNSKKNSFCPKCGAMRPAESKPASTPEDRRVSCCAQCGTAVEFGKTLCRSCRMKLRPKVEPPVVPPEHPIPSSGSVYNPGKPFSEGRAEPSNGGSRIKKGLKPPTTFD